MGDFLRLCARLKGRHGRHCFDVTDVTDLESYELIDVYKCFTCVYTKIKQRDFAISQKITYWGKLKKDYMPTISIPFTKPHSVHYWYRLPINVLRDFCALFKLQIDLRCEFQFFPKFFFYHEIQLFFPFLFYSLASSRKTSQASGDTSTVLYVVKESGFSQDPETQLIDRRDERCL